MNFSRIFIERPVMTALLSLSLLLFGGIAFRALPVAALPSVDYPTIQVTASVPGANPETMASTVATPLMYTVNEYGDTMLAQRISMVPGVSRVQIFGAQKYAVRVQVDPDKLASRGIGIDEVQRAVAASNSNLPTGRLDGDAQAFTIQSSGGLREASAYRPIIVSWRKGTPVRLEELGRVIDSVDTDKVMAWYDNRRA